jgi:hypothetical protein
MLVVVVVVETLQAAQLLEAVELVAVATERQAVLMARLHLLAQ